jgi:hypothetical protein
MSSQILDHLRSSFEGEMVDDTTLDQPVPSYALLFFDHLYSEYLTLRSSIKDDSRLKMLHDINQKRQARKLMWSDIYTFDLTLVDVRTPESLIRKAFDARARYRSIAGQKEYDEYLASKPPDLATIRIDPDAPPPDPSLILRADIRYLLSKFYLYYAMLPVRENLRDQLTRRATIVTGLVVVTIAVAILLNVTASFFLGQSARILVVFVTILTVALAGIIGGCVSMLQRIQSAPSEGDALFNLAALTNGWRGIILSPLYGGIFASLLFVLFAAGILNGSVFPTIHTPKGALAPAAAPSPSPAPSSTSSPTPTGSPGTSAGQVEKSSPSPSPPLPIPADKGSVLQINAFLQETGPADGISYALLIIWSFLAGFAERLVPDTLNRLVAKNQAIQGQ